MRDYYTGTAEEMFNLIKEGFYLHPCDGYPAGHIYPFDFRDHNVQEDIDGDYYIFRNIDTGVRFKVDEINNRYTMDGQIYKEENYSEESLITCHADIARIVPQNLPMNWDSEFGQLTTLRYLSAHHPDHHFSFDMTTPFPNAVFRCGSYEAGLTLLQEDPSLFIKVLEAEMERELKKLPAIIDAGAKSILLCTYLTGADTISPNTFRRMLLPLEIEMVSSIRAAGLDVLYWFLGDMAPLLEDFRKIPFTALAPEQPRKGYGVPYKDMRNALGNEICIMSHTWEDDMVHDKTDHMREYFDTQYQEAGQNGAFIANSTITPMNAKQAAQDHYASIVDEYVY